MLSYLCGCFDKMTFVKPVLSRPASAERYLVCQGYVCDKEFDGMKWRDKMLSNDVEEATARTYPPLEKFMDSFDRDMIRLNIDTCASIINYLNAKERGDVLPKRPHLDLRRYVKDWLLHMDT